MLINSIDKKTLKAVSERFGKRFVKEPLFMFFCSSVNKREQFITDYMRYYIPRYVEDETVFIDSSATAMVSLVDPANFEYKFKGLSGQKLKKYSFSSTVFVHKENLESICETVFPDDKPARVMTCYANPNGDFDRIKALIDEAIEFADKEGIAIAYDTFSRKLIDYMLTKGFVMTYQKPFLDTQFIETVMVYGF